MFSITVAKIIKIPENHSSKISGIFSNQSTYHPRQRVDINQFKAFHHLGRAFLVYLEMGGLDVALVGLLVGVDFEDVDLAGVFLGLHREKGQHAGFHLHRSLADFLGEGHIFLQMPMEGNAERVIKAKIIKRFRMDIIAKELMFTKIKTIVRAVSEVAMNIY